jgi:rhodanese-related sulfurtransferase
MIENISAGEMKRYLQDRRYVIVDLRSDREYQRSHVKNSISLNPYEIRDWKSRKELQGKKVVLYCARGGESMRLAVFLNMQGYDVRNVIGGFRELQNYPEYLVTNFS